MLAIATNVSVAWSDSPYVIFVHPRKK